MPHKDTGYANVTGQGRDSQKKLLDFPFDLNNLLNFQFDQLKQAIEYLAHR